MEVRSVRVDEIRLIKEDIPNPWTRYVGRSDSFLAADDEEWWQIMRIVKEGSIWTTTYANKGSFTAKWSDRATYFPAVTVSYAAFNTDLSGGDFCSDTINGGDGGLALQYTWSGNNAADGSLQIETSVDGVCWCNYPTDPFVVPLTDGCKPIEIQATTFPFYRICYTANSNTTGSLDIAYHVGGAGNKIWWQK